MHNSVANVLVPIRRVVIVFFIEHFAKERAEVGHVGVGEQNQDTSIEEEHYKDTACDAGHELRICGVPNPRDKIDSDHL